MDVFWDSSVESLLKSFWVCNKRGHILVPDQFGSQRPFSSDWDQTERLRWLPAIFMLWHSFYIICLIDILPYYLSHRHPIPKTFTISYDLSHQIFPNTSRFKLAVPIMTYIAKFVTLGVLVNQLVWWNFVGHGCVSHVLWYLGTAFCTQFILVTQWDFRVTERNIYMQMNSPKLRPLTLLVSLKGLLHMIVQAFEDNFRLKMVNK